MATIVPITSDTPIIIKVSVNDNLKKLKLPLKDLGAVVFLDKLRHLLGITPEQTVVFERFSDSAGGYVVLDPANPAVFKTLIRAAKAKLKLRLKATVTPDPASHVNTQIDIASLLQQDPIIARTPVYSSPPRAATALDFGYMGPRTSQFMQFKESMDRQDGKQRTGEAPLPRPFSLMNDLSSGTSEAYKAHVDLALRTRPSIGPMASPPLTWSVYCNMCDTAMSNAHYHCSICDGGDYDLCEGCVESGRLCPGEDHWLVKRFIKDGRVISSTTERLAPKPKHSASIMQEPAIKTEDEKEMPGSFMDDAKTLADEVNLPFRTCNDCVNYGKENEFVTCTACDDFDLCLPCLASNKHGHHPAHTFKPATETTVLSLVQTSLLPAGRNARHNAICDGCDKNIYGVRHKCFNCPDFDYCNDCVKRARHTHPHHRFAALYEPLPQRRVIPAAIRHNGIYCDGAACTAKPKQSYIEGVRYKCVVCHDTDFCASCEALPGSAHNKTHPMIKIKTPIKGLNVSTASETPSGVVRDLGDRKPEVQPKRELTEEVRPMQSPNATAPVQTVADIKPSVGAKMAPSSPSKAHFVDAPKPSSMNAQFLHDAIPDGTVIAPNERFTQIWNVRNPGPHSWPAGCSVRYVGGDNMLNVDNKHVASVSDIAEATESNVIGREVHAAEEVAFKVTLKSPAREGKAISYWRLKAADGTPFGHRLWCDIDVKSVAVPIAHNVVTLSTSIPGDRTIGEALGQNLMTSVQSGVDHHGAGWVQSQVPDMSQLNRMQSYYAQYLKTMAASYKESALSSSKLREPSRVAQENNDILQLRAVDVQQRLVADNQRLAADLQHRRAMYHQAAPFPVPTMVKPQSFASEAMLMPVDAKVVEAEEQQVEAEADTKDDEKLRGSQMIFPTLEKESPASSTYQSMTSSRNSKGKAAYVEDEESGEKTADAAIPGTTDESVVAAELTSPAYSASASGSEAVTTTDEGFEDLTDDLEVLSADEEEGEDTGFLTDDEYDILDASDQETVASK